MHHYVSHFQSLIGHGLGSAIWEVQSWKDSSLEQKESEALVHGLGLFAASQQRKGVDCPFHCYDPENHCIAMGLLYELIVDTEAGTTTIQIEANTKEEALESGQELYPGCRLALVNPEPGEQNG